MSSNTLDLCKELFNFQDKYAFINEFEYLILDSSTLIDFYKSDVESQTSGLDNYKLAITETTFSEFLGLTSEDKLNSISVYMNFNNEEINCKLSFLEKKGFYIFPKLHDLVKEECFGLKTTPIHCSSVKKQLQNCNLKELIEGYQDQRSLCQGNSGIPEITKNLENKIEKFKQTINNVLCKYNNTLNILLPRNNGLIEKIVKNDKLFECKMPLDKAEERAINLIKNSNKSFEIIIVSVNSITWIIAENKILVKKYEGNLEEVLPYTFRLLLWNCIHSAETKSKKGNRTIIAEQLEGNSAYDIEIFLNSISTKNLFISGDKGDFEYCKLIFGTKLRSEEKTLNKKTYYLLQLGV
jgi:hypothetical protein